MKQAILLYSIQNILLDFLQNSGSYAMKTNPRPNNKMGDKHCLPKTYVRPAAHVSNGLKSRIRPVVGRIGQCVCNPKF